MDEEQEATFVTGFNQNRKELVVARIGNKLGGIEVLIVPY